MTSRIHTQNQRTKKETQNFSTTPVQGMFQSRPFVMQAQRANQISDLNTTLIRAEKYGHHFNQMHSTSVSDNTAVQPKVDVEQPVQLAKGKNKKSNNQQPQEERRKQGDHVFNDFIGDTQDMIGGNLPFHSGVGIEGKYRKQKVDYSPDGSNNATTYGNKKKEAQNALEGLKKNNVKPGSTKNKNYNDAMQALKRMQESAIDKSAYDQTKGNNKIVHQTNQYRQGLGTMNDRILDQFILSEQYKKDKLAKN